MSKLFDVIEKPISGEWGEDDNDNTGILVLRTTNFTNAGVVNYSNVITRKIIKKNISEKYLRKGDIIIEKSGGSEKQPVGRVVYFDGPDDTYLFNNFTSVLRIKSSELMDSKYLFYALYFNYKKGGTRKYQNKTTGLHNLKIDQYFADFRIIDIPYERQVAISSVLDKTSSLLCLRKEYLQELDDLIKSRFVEMFGDPIINPKGWMKKKLSDECDIVTGNTPSRKNPEYYGNYIEWIKSDNINTPSPIITRATESLSEIGLSVARSVEAGSILMTCIAGSIKCIGNVAITDRKVSFNQQINAIVPKCNNTWFIYEQLELSKQYVQSTINMSLKGILSKGKLSEIEFIFPPVELQNEFGAFVQAVDKLKFETQKAIDNTQMLLDSLMQKYFE